MSKHKNTVHLVLSISKNEFNSYEYQYYCLLDNGALVKVEGFIIDRPTKFVVELSEITKDAYDIKECLIPGIQDVVVVDKISDDSVTLTDKDTGEFPKDYNFIIIAKDKHNHRDVICDPQIRNKEKI